MLLFLNLEIIVYLLHINTQSDSYFNPANSIANIAIIPY